MVVVACSCHDKVLDGVTLGSSQHCFKHSSVLGAGLSKPVLRFFGSLK